MAEGLIKCPKCGAEFELSQAVSHDIEVKVAKKFQKEIKKREEEYDKGIEAEREKTKKKEEELSDKIEMIQKQAERKAKEKAERSNKIELEDLKTQVKEKDNEILKNQEQELELRKKQRELEKKAKTMELETARKLDEARAKIKEETLKNYEEQHRLKDAEKDKQLMGMREQIDELKRKAEQGSQKTQGEILELELEKRLKTEFPFDNIEPVSSGIKGADVIQTVRTNTGKTCGKILWETKRTKTWSDKWLQKMKYDQREAKANIAVIVSEALPQGVNYFRQIEGVWVSSISSAESLGIALRVVLIQVSREKKLQDGKADKMELVYNYLTGVEFKNRVEAILEAFVGMKADLDKEKRAMNKIWDKRDKQIERVILNIGGMRGDIEGLAGVNLPKIKQLELSGKDSNKKKQK